MQDNNLPKVLVPIFNRIFNQLHFLSCQERAETAGAVKPILFANLPVAGEFGRLRFVTNGRKSGEGAGAGTGVLCYDDTLSWKRTADDTTVVA